MKPRNLLISAAVIAAAALNSSSAMALTATLSATYYQVANNGADPDFEIYNTPNVAAGSALGPNGLPVATSPYGVSDIDSTTHEITWWSPALNSNVSQTGTGTISLPYASNMYAPNSTGGNDSSAFETAVFKGDFSLATPSTVTFNLGSDDDSFIYVDGTLFGQNPGVHGVTNVNFTSPTLSAGSHSIDVFYDDRHTTGAYLSLDLVSEGVIITPPAVPEPATWAMMLAGFGLIGYAMRKRAHTVVAYS